MTTQKMPIAEMIRQKDLISSNKQLLTLHDFCGQEKLKEKLHLYIKAANIRNEPLDHILFSGPPGLGKTTLATIMAHELKTHIKICSGPMLEKTGDLVAILTSLQSKDIFFIDEIHRLPINIEEILYSAMEQYKVDVILGQGAGAKTVSLPVNPFTLIGATTKSGLISAPLRTRFGIQERLDFYTDQELMLLLEQYAYSLNLKITPQAGALIAHCSRGTPRVAKKIFLRVRDFASIHHHTTIAEQTVHAALDLLGISLSGLTSGDITILTLLSDRYPNPVGLETLACLVSEDAQTIEEVYEPFLLRMGYIEKTPRGRIITQAGLKVNSLH
jgi:holliday junction DNA helicase RuvB